MYLQNQYCSVFSYTCESLFLKCCVNAVGNSKIFVDQITNTFCYSTVQTFLEFFIENFIVQCIYWEIR